MLQLEKVQDHKQEQHHEKIRGFPSEHKVSLNSVKVSTFSELGSHVWQLGRNVRNKRRGRAWELTEKIFFFEVHFHSTNMVCVRLLDVRKYKKITYKSGILIQ